MTLLQLNTGDPKATLRLEDRKAELGRLGTQRSPSLQCLNSAKANFLTQPSGRVGRWQFKSRSLEMSRC
ncbi:MAG: hypothetical protein WCS37_08740 [Chloroflexota bacterium]|nr:hypothetical protein [Chloroflexota bacterium]